MAPAHPERFSRYMTKVLHAASITPRANRQMPCLRLGTAYPVTMGRERPPPHLLVARRPIRPLHVLHRTDEQSYNQIILGDKYI